MLRGPNPDTLEQVTCSFRFYGLLLPSVCFACFAASCSKPVSAPAGHASHDAAVDAPNDAPADGGCVSPYATGPGASAPAWCQVDRVLSQSLASADASTSQLPGFAFQVYTFDAAASEPVLRYSRAEGTIAGSQAAVTLPMPTASAAKMMTALLLARAAVYASARGATLSPATTIDVLGCSGLPSGVAGTSLSDLMHQTAGLTADTENSCVNKASVPLATCACDILQNDYVPAYDGTFAYTPHNFVVAAAMADAVLAKLSPPSEVRSVFKTWLGEVGLPATEARLPLSNNFAGGDRISAHAYATLLALALPGPARGTYHGHTLLDAAILDQMSTPFGSNVVLTYSPYVEGAGLKMRYGFGDWVQCSNAWPEPSQWPAPNSPVFALDYAGCAYRPINSLGKFGYMPWFVDRTSRPYAAVLAVDLPSNGGRVSTRSFAAFEMLDPAVRAAIDAAP